MKDQLKIILAEDDRDDSFLFQEALNRMPFDTHLYLAQDGELFMEMLYKQDIPDFIFLDLNMPKKDGYSCLAEIRSLKKMEKVPVIVLSTSSHKESIQRAYEAGADLYVRKPDKFTDLIKIIEICLQQQSLYPDRPPKENFFLVMV